MLQSHRTHASGLKQQSKPAPSNKVNLIIKVLMKGNHLMYKKIILLAIGLVVLLAGGAVLVRAQSTDSSELPDKIYPDTGSMDSSSRIGSVLNASSRVYSVNPGGFLYDSDSTDIVMSTYLGLVWAAGSSDEGGFYMRRPADWDGQTPIVATITFALGGNQAGTVNWRLKLNTYTPGSGEWLTNPGSRDADAILTFPDGPSWYRIYSQTFTIPAADFHDEPYWSIYFLRGDGSNGETFPGNLYVMGVDISYTTAP
jgi:hypothetical protein